MEINLLTVRAMLCDVQIKTWMWWTWSAFAICNQNEYFCLTFWARNKIQHFYEADVQSYGVIKAIVAKMHRIRQNF